MQVVKDTKSSGVFVWVSEGDPHGRDLLTTTAAEFKLDVRFCGYGDALTLLRNERGGLVGIEVGVDPQDGVRLLKQIGERLPRVTVFAACADASVATIRALLEAGASEILSLPLNAQELSKALIKFTQLGPSATAQAPATGEVYTIYGARGGLGATTLAVNVAVRIGLLTRSEVALVDLDLQRGDVAAFLNLTPLQSLATIASARSEVDEIFLHGTMTRHPSGVDVLPAPLQMEEADLIGQEDVALVLGLLRSQFRYTVVDTPRTITATALTALEQSDRILLMTDLSVPGVRAAQRCLELFIRLGIPSPRVDLLLAETVPGPVTLKDAVRAIGKDPLLTVPRDEAAARDAMNTGAPLNGAKPSGLAVSISELAGKLVGGATEPRARRGHLLRRIFTREGAR